MAPLTNEAAMPIIAFLLFIAATAYAVAWPFVEG